MALTTIATNGVPVEDYGLIPINLEEWLSPPRVKYGEIDLIGRLGKVASVRGMVYEPRRLQIGVQASSASATTIVLGRSAIEAWYSACRGMIEVEVVDAPGKVCYGLFEGAKTDVFGIKLLSPLAMSIGEIVCHDPLWYDRSPVTVSAAAATRVAVPVGSAPGVVKFSVLGAATNPTVTLRSRTGAVLGQMRFTATLGATESIEVDSQSTWPVTRWTSGVASDGFSLLNTDDSLLGFDPMDGPTLETSTGSLIVTTWRGYLS